MFPGPWGGQPGGPCGGRVQSRLQGRPAGIRRGEGRHSDGSVSRHRREARWDLKLERGGNFGILSRCAQPSSDSFQRGQLLSWSLCPGKSQGWDTAGRHSPTWPLRFRTAVTAGSRGRSSDLLARLLGEDSSVSCELTAVCMGLSSGLCVPMTGPAGLLLGAHSR